MTVQGAATQQINVIIPDICRLFCMKDKGKGKGLQVSGLIARLLQSHTQGAQVWITQFFTCKFHHTQHYLSLPRKRSQDGATTDCSGRHLIAAYFKDRRSTSVQRHRTFRDNLVVQCVQHFYKQTNKQTNMFINKRNPQSYKRRRPKTILRRSQATKTNASQNHTSRIRIFVNFILQFFSLEFSNVDNFQKLKFSYYIYCRNWRWECCHLANCTFCVDFPPTGALQSSLRDRGRDFQLPTYKYKL